MNHDFNELLAQKELEKGYEQAEKLLEDRDKLEEFLQRLEKKLREIPHIGEGLSSIPVMASLINSYVKKEYTDIPAATIVAVIGALVYFVSPVDLIPDMIPGIGLLDDAAVVAACLRLVKGDLDAYSLWREGNGKIYEV